MRNKFLVLEESEAFEDEVWARWKREQFKQAVQAKLQQQMRVMK